MAEHPPVDAMVDACFRIASQRRKLVVAEAVLALYERTGSWTCMANRIGGYLHGTGYDHIKGNRIPSRTDWWKAAHGQCSKTTENALRAYLGLMPRQVRSVERMRTADLAWYFKTRKPYREDRE